MAGRHVAPKEEVMKQINGLDKESHVKGLAAKLLRKCPTMNELDQRIMRANEVVKEIRKRGVSSFFAVEYGTLFKSPKEAVNARREMIKHFEDVHGLPAKQAAKIADCAVFAAAKKPEADLLERVKALGSEALAAGVPFDVAADVVYYNAPDTEAQKFSMRCGMTAEKKGKPLGIEQEKLTERLEKVAAGHPVPVSGGGGGGGSMTLATRVHAIQEVLDELEEFGSKKDRF